MTTAVSIFATFGNIYIFAQLKPQLYIFAQKHQDINVFAAVWGLKIPFVTRATMHRCIIYVNTYIHRICIFKQAKYKNFICNLVIFIGRSSFLVFWKAYHRSQKQIYVVYIYKCMYISVSCLRCRFYCFLWQLCTVINIWKYTLIYEYVCMW